MSNDIWPIRPTFLSLAKGSMEETANFNTDGIYYADYIRGFLADLSHDHHVQNALSMFQFVPADFIPLDNNADERIEDIPETDATVLLNPAGERAKGILGKRKVIRIDSGTFVNNGECCDKFRKCSPKNLEFCYVQDSRVAIFASSSLEKSKDFEDYKTALDKLVTDFNKKEKSERTKLKLKIWNNRIYIQYTCPIFCFEEHIFPIYAKGRIIACLMLGQMARDEYNADDPFNHCGQVMECTKSNCDIFKDKPEVKKLTNKDWNKKLNAIIERINIFEKRLEDKINHRSENYINDEFRKVKNEFNLKVKNIKIRDNNIPATFFNALSQALAEIHDVFDGGVDGFIRMFALPMDDGSEHYKVLGWSDGSANSSCLENFKKYYFNVKSLKELSLEKISDELTVEQIKEILKKSASIEINNKYNQEKDTLRIVKLVDDGISFIVWKRHTNNRAKEDKDAFKAYKDALVSFYTIAFQCYSYIRGAKMEYVLETTIRTTAHESAHFILPALHVVEEKMQIIPKEMILSAYAEEYRQFSDSYIRYRENAIELLKQLSEINTRPSIIFKEIVLEKQAVEVFYLLYKMKKMMDDKASEKHHQIIYEQKNNYVQVNLDYIYFNHALFNLVDNAIKYGYEGSNIYIKMEKSSENIMVKIVSFGAEIEKGERIYKLFERGRDFQEIRGMGIGMFIVRKICEAHKGLITHTSEKISSFNIPVLNCAKNSFLLQDLTEDLKSEILHEFSTIEKHVIEEVVYDSKFIKYPNVFSTRIIQPTYRNSFIVIIPT